MSSAREGDCSKRLAVGHRQGSRLLTAIGLGIGVILLGGCVVTSGNPGGSNGPNGPPGVAGQSRGPAQSNPGSAGGATASPTSHGVPAKGPCFVVAPMQVLYVRDGQESKEPVLELSADGTVVALKSQMVGKFRGDRFEGRDNEHTVICRPDGALVDGAGRTGASYRGDVLVTPNNEYRVLDDGRVMGANGLQRTRVVNMPPGAKRTAAFLVALLQDKGL